MPEAVPEPRGPFPRAHRFAGFLSGEERSALIDYSLANRSRFIPSRLVGNVLDPDRRVSEPLPDVGPLRPVLENRLAERLPEIFQRTELAAHGDGAFFANHSVNAWLCRTLARAPGPSL